MRIILTPGKLTVTNEADLKYENLRKQIADLIQQKAAVESENETLLAEIQSMKEDKRKIIGLFPGCVVTKDKLYRIGDEYEHEGKKDYIQVVNVRESVVKLASGKIIGM